MLILEDGNSVFFRPDSAQRTSSLGLFGDLLRGSYFESMTELLKVLPSWAKPQDVRSAMKYEVLKPRFVSLRAEQTFPNLRMRIIGPMRNFEDYRLLPLSDLPEHRIPHAHFRNRQSEALADAVTTLMERAPSWGTDVSPGWAGRARLRFTKVSSLPEESSAGGYREAAVSGERILARSRNGSTWTRLAGRLLQMPIADRAVLTEHGLYLEGNGVWFVPVRPEDVQVHGPERLILGQCVMVHFPKGVADPVFQQLEAWGRGVV